MNRIRMMLSVFGFSLLCVLQANRSSADEQDWPHWLGTKHDAVWRETGLVSRFPKEPLEPMWRTPVSGGFSGPTVVGKRVFVTDFVLKTGTSNNLASGSESVSGQERVLALDAETGKPLWTHSYPVAYSVSYPSGPRTSPVVHDKRVYTVGTDGDLLCLSADDGSVIWSKNFRKDYGVETPFWGHSAHPFVLGDTLVCLVGARQAIVVAFDLNNGKERWRALSGKEPGYAPPTVATFGSKQTLLVWHPESLNALNPKDGSLIWSLPMTADYGMSVTAPWSALVEMVHEK